MKSLFLGLCLLLCGTSVLAQPQAINQFSEFVDTSIASQNQALSILQLAERGSVALLSLRRPLNGSELAVAVAWGKDGVLLLTEGNFTFQTLPEIEALYAGTALVPVASNAALRIDEAVRIVSILDVSYVPQIVARYTLRNTGATPLDVSVDSTSPDSTTATLDKNSIEAGGTAELTVTARAMDGRLTYVKLASSDENLPHLMVAARARRVFEPFQPPSPITLNGERGQSIGSRMTFELPVGWKIARVTATPDWLQTELTPRPAFETAPGETPALPRYQLAVTAPFSAPEGAIKGQISLQLEGAPLRSLSVVVGGVISDDIKAMPRMLALRDSPQGLARRVVVISGPRPFSICAIHSEMRGFEARFEPNVESRTHTVELWVRVAGAKGDSFFERAIVELSDGRELALDIMGSVAEGTLPDTANQIELDVPALK